MFCFAICNSVFPYRIAAGVLSAQIKYQGQTLNTRILELKPLINYIIAFDVDWS